MNTNNLEFNGDNIYLKYSVGGDSSDILDFVNSSPTLPRFRYFVGGVTASDIIFQLYTDKINCKRNVELDTGYELKTNTINSNGDNDLVFQRDDDEFFRCEVFTDAQATTYNLIDVIAGTRFSAHHIYVGNIINRANGFDYSLYRFKRGR